MQIMSFKRQNVLFVILERKAIFKSGGANAGLHCPEGATLTISDGTDDGTGKLTAAGSFATIEIGADRDYPDGAGIGGTKGELMYYSEGKALTGWQTIDDKKYFFDSHRAAFAGGWMQDEDGKWY